MLLSKHLVSLWEGHSFLNKKTIPIYKILYQEFWTTAIGKMCLGCFQTCHRMSVSYILLVVVWAAVSGVEAAAVAK